MRVEGVLMRRNLAFQRRDDSFDQSERFGSWARRALCNSGAFFSSTTGIRRLSIYDRKTSCNKNLRPAPASDSACTSHPTCCLFRDPNDT
jgi:hypothetical protein